MDKRILLPTDFSRNALNAARYAMDLFQQERCTFFLFNVYQVRGYSIDNMMVPEPGELAYETAREQSERGLGKFLEQLKLHAENPKHHFEAISSFNSLVYGVKYQIAKKDIDLVVMGTRGATDARSIIFGTNTVQVMEGITESPVLAVPSEYRYSPLTEIAFPTDFKAIFKRRELKYLLDVVQQNDAFVHVLHIENEPFLSRDQQTNKALLESILEEVPHQIHIMTHTNVHKGIGEFVASRKIGLIAFMNRKHTFLGKLLSRPLVKELGYYYNIPVLELNT